MRPRDRRIHRYRPVHQPLGVGLRDQRLHDRVPGAFGREPAMPGPHGLPRAEHCRKIAPRDPAPIPVNDPFQHRPRVRELPTRATRRPRQHPIDQRPLSIRKQPKPRHRSSVSTDPLNLCQTRPRPALPAPPRTRATPRPPRHPPDQSRNSPRRILRPEPARRPTLRPATGRFRQLRIRAERSTRFTRPPATRQTRLLARAGRLRIPGRRHSPPRPGTCVASNRARLPGGLLGD